MDAFDDELEPRSAASEDFDDEQEEGDSESGRVLALVTGGGRRLGQRLVRALAAEGFDVAIAYHHSVDGANLLVDELQAEGAEVSAFRADLRQAGECEGLIDSVETEMGPIGLLVNNAGLLLDADIDTATVEDLDHSFAVNLRAPYLLSLLCGRRMRDRGEGSIVNVASVGGLRPYLRHIPYSVTKAGLVMLTEALALALAPEVTVNAIAPGTVWLGAEEDTEQRKPSRDRIPLEEWADPQDVEDALVYLATAPHVTGQILAVDGGAHLGLRPRR